MFLKHVMGQSQRQIAYAVPLIQIVRKSSFLTTDFTPT